MNGVHLRLDYSWQGVQWKDALKIKGRKLSSDHKSALQDFYIHWGLMSFVSTQETSPSLRLNFGDGERHIDNKIPQSNIPNTQ